MYNKIAKASKVLCLLLRRWSDVKSQRRKKREEKGRKGQNHDRSQNAGGILEERKR
jgi:hypothetical protein